MSSSQTLLLAGGGTGGHVFPALAIAEEWKRRGGQVVFVGTAKGLEAKVIPTKGYPLELLKVGQLKGRGLGRKVKTVLGLIPAIVQAVSILKRYRPQIVVGVGGYASGPACLAAWLARYPLAVTDQNSRPGLTNRVLARLAQKVFLSFEEAKAYFQGASTEFVGNPVRAQIEYQPYQKPADEVHVLILGGSQGAVSLNQAVTDAFLELKNSKKRWVVHHQAGQTDLKRLQSFYKDHDIDATVEPFFENVSALYAQAHLVICRSGASTLTELALAGRPSLLVPYPYAADDHQWHNAQSFVSQGAALAFRQESLDGALLAKTVGDLVADDRALSDLADRARSLARPKAAEDLVNGLQQLIQQK